MNPAPLTIDKFYADQAGCGAAPRGTAREGLIHSYMRMDQTFPRLACSFCTEYARNSPICCMPVHAARAPATVV